MWMACTERDILLGKFAIADKTFGDLLARYASSVSISKRGALWEQKKIKQICRDYIAGVPLDNLNQVDFAAWRDRRLKDVTPATVLREWNLISHALNVAVNEWKWLQENPIRGVKRPRAPQSRTRRIEEDEIDRLLLALGYDYELRPETVTARVGAAMLFAIETAMRAGEITSLTWRDVDVVTCVAHLPVTKNGFPRDVPLSAEAVRILEQVREGEESVFRLQTSQIDSLFRKGKKRALINDLHFHDTRAEAITRLAKRVNILTLARISGHRDLRMLQVYYRESAQDIAERL